MTNAATLASLAVSGALSADSSGNVGVGTSSPIRKLTVAASSSPEFVLQETSGGTDAKNWRIFNSGNRLYFGTLNDAGTSGTDTFSINSSGVLLNASARPVLRQTGSVLQVVSTTKTDTFSTTSTSFVDITGLSVTITPSSTSSKILIVVNAIGGSGGTAGALCTFRLMRDSTAINIGNAAGGYTQASVGGMRSPLDVNSSWLVPMNFLDSPATTSAITYKVQGSIESNTLRINSTGSDTSGSQWSYRGASTITVMEIAG